MFLIPLETVRSIFTKASGLEDLARRLEAATKSVNHKIYANELVQRWHERKKYTDNINKVRRILELSPLAFLEN